MINLKKSGLSLLLALLILFKSFGQTALQQAEKQYNNLSYLNATELFENALKGKLSDAEKQSAKIKLAYAYRQIRDSQNAERVYREVVESGADLSGDASKAYLYYAQALASNGKYKEAQEIYDKYSKIASADTRSSGFQKLYQNPESLSRNAGCYKVDYLNINSGKADFSPMYYKNGLVFCSGRTEGVGLKRVFSWDNSRFLDMYYLQDLTQLTTTASGLGGSNSNTGKVKKSGGQLGSDEYTPLTANDSKTLGYYGGTYITQGANYSEEPSVDSKIFSKTINTKYHEGPMTFSGDGSKMYFTRNNYNNGKYKTSSDKINKLKIYTAEDKSGTWTNIKEVPFNSDEYSTGHPSITRDDKLMYFISDMPGGIGGTDIYVVQNTGGSWGVPVNLGPEINTAGNEMFPFADEKGNLYFSSDGHPGLGDLDVFYVELADGKVKGKVKNLGTPINSSKDDFGFITDGERKTGFFSSNRKRGGLDDDIYRFTRECDEKPECRELQVLVFDADSKMPLDNADVEVATGSKTEMKRTDTNGQFKLCLDDDKEYTFRASRDGYLPNQVGFSTKGDNNQSTLDIPLSRQKTDTTKVAKSVSLPCKVTTIRGKVTANRDKKPIEGVVVTLKNECDGTTQQVITGKDGSYQFDICEGCDYQLDAAKENFGSRSNKIKKVGKDAPEFISSNLSMFEENEVVQMDNIYYDYGKYNIRPDAAKELEKIVTMMKRYGKMRIEIRSHTDSRSSSEFNQQLSENRSKSVVRYLHKRGIALHRMEASGYGETQLLNECADNVECTEEQHAVNRRSEFKVLQLK